jgi:UbiD family decarboxylase
MMPSPTFKDLRSFVEACKEIGECKEIRGADWDREIGAITEAAAELLPHPPLLLFDEIKGYPKGFRMVTLPYGTHRRTALSLGLPTDKSKLELLRLMSRKMQEAKPIPPVEVERGPVMENVMMEGEVDLYKIPSPIHHEEDGGRYIGTGDLVINRDPESGYVNVGTYRIQVHGPNLLGLWMSPGQQGRQICERYWERGQSCPIALVFGGDAYTFAAAHTKLPWIKSEFDFAGGLQGSPVEVIKGPVTGLPIPAHAEIAVEGEVPPPSVEAHEEGPFGEWTGYYSGGTKGTGRLQPVIRVKAMYHRNDPILHNSSPMWPGAPFEGLEARAGLLWDQLEAAGIQDIAGVYCHSAFMVVVSIRQRYAGHAKQAGMTALGCAATARNGRYVVVVDEDIDPTDMKEVLWAMETRVDPAIDIQLVSDCWSTPLDPRMPPAKREALDYTNSRAIFYAVKPFGWKDKYPRVSRTSKEYRAEILEKYRSVLFEDI